MNNYLDSYRNKGTHLKRSTLQIKNLLFWGFLSILLVACGGDNKLQPLEIDSVVLAFGDSLTDGVGVAREDSYPSALSRLIGRQVINEGISGETTSEGVKRFEQVLDKHQPQLVILLEGGNDILRNHNLSVTKSNLSAMIEMAKKKSIDVVLIGVPEKDIFSDHADLYAELSNEHDVVFEGEIIAYLMKRPSFKSDPIHFNKKGYQKLAEDIQTLLESNGAL